MNADSVQVGIRLMLSFVSKWENLLFIDMPYVTVFVFHDRL